MTVLHDYRNARQKLGAQIYMHGVADKFGGDVAGALRSSIPEFGNRGGDISSSADFSERKSSDSAMASSSYSGRLPPMASKKRRGGGRSRRSAGGSRTVADILAEHAVRKNAQNGGQ